MPKVKTHKGTAKRFQYSGGGKILRTRHMKSHLRRNKTRRTKAQFDEMLVASDGDQKRIKRLLPYGT